METLKIERRRTTYYPAFRPKRRTLDKRQIRVLLKYAALTVAGIMLFRAGHAQALLDRGYEALGGEVFALFLPALYYLISRTARDTIKDIQSGKSQSGKNRKRRPQRGN